MGNLRRPRNVSYDRNSGWPTGRESYGHGVLIVVDGVTSIQGERESHLQGEGGQVGEFLENISEEKRNATNDTDIY